ncbi:hypothetical protein DCC39_10250 [Pueribacillus theae]|uniref:Uncharacterized protein n=1 Tax=Pueribacillus theae TaxID=2171751 RepID=A0A2U1K0N5_9BACI|nr:hypothetical protein [Pueribacillus theae]PWA11070.1 hypothetical protein DCC39_10250 [Pueribacillus theae]
MGNDAQSVPINLTTITSQSSLAQINNNFRKIQAEVSGVRQDFGRRVREFEDHKDYMERYLDGERPANWRK